MKRIIYCSQATYDIAPGELVTLLEGSRRNNEAAGLSGMLLYSSQSFLQVLEGDPAALAATYARIETDDRHSNLRLLLDAEVAAPLFPDWTMGSSTSTTRTSPTSSTVSHRPPSTRW